MQHHSSLWNSSNVFDDRKEAGELLAQKLQQENHLNDCLILGITRGGVVVAAKLAEKLHMPFDIVTIKKIGAPGNQELAIGAVGPGKTVVWDDRLVKEVGIDDSYKVDAAAKKEQERAMQEDTLRKDKQPLSLGGRDVILVDDGVATGTTVLCAREYLVKKKAKKIILAVPVIAEDTIKHLTKQFDTIVTLRIEKDFGSVGQFYRDFPQVADDEVVRIVNRL